MATSKTPAKPNLNTPVKLSTDRLPSYLTMKRGHARQHIPRGKGKAGTLYQTTADNYVLPGLPRVETFKQINPVILDDVPTIDQLARMLESSNSQTLVTPWTISVLQGFRTYIPTTFRRVTSCMTPDEADRLFGKDPYNLPDDLKTLLQLQSELESKGATIDAAIIHDRKDLGTVVNKAQTINRLYHIGRIYGFLKERPAPFLFDRYGSLRDPKTWDRALSDIKMLFIAFTREVPIGNRHYELETRKVDVSAKQLRDKYVHLEWLKRKLGDDLVGVLLYGSSARTDDPTKYSDFDNWVRVKDVQRAHRILAGTNPVVIDGKVVELRGHKGEDPPGSKHVGIHVLPESDKYLYRYTRFLHDPIEFLLHTRVLYGEFPMPTISQDEVIERGMSQAHIKLKTIAASLNWAYHDPKRLVGRQALFEFVVKNLRFFMQHSLNALELPEFRRKEDIDERLGRLGLEIPKYKPDAGYIKQSLLYAMVGAMKLQKWYHSHDRKPDLGFLAGGGYFPKHDIVDFSIDWAKVDSGL